MSRSSFTVSIAIDMPSGEIVETFDNISNTTTLNNLLVLLKQRLNFLNDFNNWIIKKADNILALETTINELEVSNEGKIKISVYFSNGEAIGLIKTKQEYIDQENIDDLSEEEFERQYNEELCLEQAEECFDMDPSAECIEELVVDCSDSHNKVSKRKQANLPQGNVSNETNETRLLVRYYSTMNPETIFPLNISFSSKVLGQIRSKNISQIASNNFKFNVNESLVIEPIIPGCQCYPPKQEIFLNENVTFTFYVFPQVIGKIDGAFVRILQNHIELEKVKLQIKVKKKTLALFFGVAAFLLPALSSVLKFYGLDFETQKAQDFSLYIFLIRFVFEYLSPSVLMAGLCGITLVSWLWATPSEEELFWDMKKIGPDELHKDILELFKNNYDLAWGKLVDMIDLFPTYLPALQTYAVLQYKNDNFKEALSGFEKAMEAGILKPLNYLRASLCASKFKYNSKALAILKTAVEVLPEKDIPANLHYNMACYHARLGEISLSLARLKISISKGFKNFNLLKKDPDLRPLRNQKEYLEIIEKFEN